MQCKNPVSYKEDIDDPVISKRTRPIDSPDTGEEDTVSKRMRCIDYKDKAEYSPSGSNYDDKDNKEELESYKDKGNDKAAGSCCRLSSSAQKPTDYHGDCQYHSRVL